MRGLAEGKRVRVLSMSDRERKSYERYLYNKAYEEDLVETAHEDDWIEDFDEGKEKTILEIVQKMRDEGMGNETIFKITGYQSI